MSAYYNEFDPNAAAWLRELIKNGLIADGEVDERSITEVTADDLRGFTQHHFFAGIGGWSYALRLAGVADDQRVWTASLPCQPFSSAGKQQGKADERHLLPHFLELVRQCRPNRIFGEQVEGAIRHGWLDDLQATMEAENYAVGHCILGAHSVGALHQRQRLYWVADNKSERLDRSEDTSWQNGRSCAETGGSIECMADTGGKRSQGYRQSGKEQVSQGWEGAKRRNGESGGISIESKDIDWLYCRDNKYRPIKSGLEPLVDGVSERLVRSGDSITPIDADKTQAKRVMRLKGYGNAIVPQVAAEFIGAFMEIAT